jgi:hypothetical protein
VQLAGNGVGQRAVIELSILFAFGQRHCRR